ncbi:hypothetical protein CC86DRAFT_338215 [Ophiobolus disseminans]|uniref:Uncharacterized protein n=1 Tax=Ophiobolus disseminans TaxID=1469910 RepID=A0A6A7AK53_9PLEO|nr:hypothetical protein CC86DRAFT_338215 [Ophiobolus disseminans]
MFRTLLLGALAATADSRGALHARQASTIAVDLTKTYQTMDGFGMSETFQRANQMKALSEPLQRYALDLLFNRTSGAGFSILRNGIGSSPDSSSDHMVSIQPKNPGGPSAAPKYVWDGNDNSQVWVSTEAVKTYGVKTVYANAWSAPGYMKTNNNDANGGSLCGVSGASCSSGDWKQAFANYLVQYITYYKELGVEVTHLGFLNEPDLTTSYASMRSNGQQAADFIRILKPELDKANFTNVKVTCCDAEGWSSQQGMMSGLSGVSSLLGTITAHSYTSQPGGPISTPHRVWQTENADLQGPWATAFYSNGGAGEGLNWANKIYDAVTRANASAYLYWVGVQGGATNSKLIRIADDKKSVIPSKRLWAFANWSRHVRPGAIRVGTSGGPSGAKISAFKNVDGKIAVQVIQGGNGAGAVTVKVNGFVVRTVKAWITDNSHDCDEQTATLATDGGSVSAQVPGRSMVTFVLEPVEISERGRVIDEPRGAASLSMAMADTDTSEVAKVRRTERDFILTTPQMNWVARCLESYLLGLVPPLKYVHSAGKISVTAASCCLLSYPHKCWCPSTSQKLSSITTSGSSNCEYSSTVSTVPRLIPSKRGILRTYHLRSAHHQVPLEDMASGSVFSDTLQTITTTKLEELAQQRNAFSQEYSSVQAAANAERDPLTRLVLLVDGTKSCLGVKTSNRTSQDGRVGRVVSGGTRNVRLETDLKNLDRFLEQAKFDPSVSAKVLEDWEKTLLQYLSVQATKYQFADLYGKLVTEWLSSEKDTPPPDTDVEMTESFEELPGAKKLAARAEWEKTVFEPADVDVQALKAYLEQLFITDKKSAAKAIQTFRSKVEDFENSLAVPGQFTVSTLRWVIQGLQASDLLPNEKREVLKDFLSNDVILREIGDVLSMRLAALDRWTWGDHVPLEQRRKLNGSFSIHMHEDVLQAIFLHYIGVKWSVFFKTAFLNIHRHSAWKSSQTQVPKTDRTRRQYFLGTQWTQQRNALENERGDAHRKRYFAHQLLDYDTQEVEVAEGEEEAEYGDRVKSMRRKKSNALAIPAMNRAASMSVAVKYDGIDYSDEDIDCDEEHWEDDNAGATRGPKKPMEAKQDLLHLLSTEVILNTRLNGELSCFRTVFESWNVLLPHQTVLQVLEFFGVSDKWTTFFTKFLKAPLKFMEDGPSTEPRLRQRGIPVSHALSDMLGESVLFCLDFAINQATDGALLHRLYDDVWFWNKDYETCAQAWETVTEFTKVMGVELDDKKTGSIRVAHGNSVEVDDRLPEGEIRWGFLQLDPSNGRFEIDQGMVDSHVEELRTQLQGKSKSVIDWIQAWNSYAATFFSSNFGKASNCFGREHVDKMLATHRHIQESIFNGGNVVTHLKQMITSRFDVSDIPDGFLFFPVELGGLDLKSPFVGLLQIRESVQENPYTLLDEFEENEREDYTALKNSFDRGDTQSARYARDNPDSVPEDPDTFLSFDEFVRYREAFRSGGKASIVSTYHALLQRPIEQPVDASVQVRQALEQLQGQSNLRGITSDWNIMEAYWKWIAQMYGPEMLQKFGGMNVVDPGLLPIGMVGFFRQRRTKWQG